MISSVPTPSLNSQFLTGPQVAWVFQVSQRTVIEWREQKLIAHFKIGDRIFRYYPEDVLRFATVHTVASASARSPHQLTTDSSDLLAVVWQRIERLIALQTEAKSKACDVVEKEAAA